jgi:chromosomal replication initiation ATPase DnaA
MPEIARFFGIIIRMYVEAGGQHQRPHFHAYYQESIGVYAVDDIQQIAGSLPTRQERLVLAWAELHQEELRADWRALQAGRPPAKIDPLR